MGSLVGHQQLGAFGTGAGVSAGAPGQRGASTQHGPAQSAAHNNGEEFTCTVCRKVFKRAANLIFHMTEHRPAAPGADAASAAKDVTMLSADSTGTASGSSGVGPVKCTDCDKEFATKYQAKKHYLRRHFSGDKPFACTKCNKKRFVVKEDLTMHMKACGNVFICKCGIRLCSLGALKRHCKQFGHEPESLEPKPENAVTLLADPAAPAWAAASDALPAPYVALVQEQQHQQLQLQQHAAAAAAHAMASAHAGGDPTLAVGPGLTL